MALKVHVSGHLRGYAMGALDMEVERAKDVLALVVALDKKFPGFKDRLLDEHDRTRIYINIFVNQDNARDLHGEATKLNDGDVIYILPSVAGGMR